MKKVSRIRQTRVQIEDHPFMRFIGETAQTLGLIIFVIFACCADSEVIPWFLCGIAFVIFALGLILVYLSDVYITIKFERRVD